jgi:hypothetical protein
MAQVSDSEIRVRVVVRRAGLEDILMVLADSHSIGRVRQQIGEAQLPLVHVPTGTLVGDEMLLHQLADRDGQVLLEMIMAGEDERPKAGGEYAERPKAGGEYAERPKAGAAATSDNPSPSFGQRVMNFFGFIGILATVVIIGYAARLYMKWKGAQKTEAVAAVQSAPAAPAAVVVPAAPAAPAK